ncbi:hypothetical protein D3C87_2004310 [compost metagenome]
MSLNQICLQRYGAMRQAAFGEIPCFDIMHALPLGKVMQGGRDDDDTFSVLTRADAGGD